MTVVLQGGKDGIRDASDTDLEGRPVRNQLRYMAADGSVHLGRYCSRDLNQRIVRLNGSIDA